MPTQEKKKSDKGVKDSVGLPATSFSSQALQKPLLWLLKRSFTLFIQGSFQPSDHNFLTTSDQILQKSSPLAAAEFHQHGGPGAAQADRLPG